MLLSRREFPGTEGLVVETWETIRSEVQTWANLVTLVRLVLGVAAFGVVFGGGRERWAYLGLVIYWIGDLLDGLLARRRGEETVFGAEFDILADRLQVCLFYLAYLKFHPEKTLVALVFLFEFMVLDHFLSNQFARWRVRSPNYFYEVDRVTWAWLWSTPAKALNCGLVTLLVIGQPWPWIPLSVTLVLIGIRLRLAWRLLALSADQREASRCTPESEAGRFGKISKLR